MPNDTFKQEADVAKLKHQIKLLKSARKLHNRPKAISRRQAVIKINIALNAISQLITEKKILGREYRPKLRLAILNWRTAIKQAKSIGLEVDGAEANFVGVIDET